MKMQDSVFPGWKHSTGWVTPSITLAAVLVIIAPDLYMAPMRDSKTGRLLFAFKDYDEIVKILDTMRDLDDEESVVEIMRNVNKLLEEARYV